MFHFTLWKIPCFEPTSFHVLCSHLKKWLWCIFLKWEELSCWVPTVSNSIQKSGRGWLPYLSPGCFLSHWGFFLEVWAFLNSVRELHRIEALKAAGPGEVRSWSGSLCFLGEPLSVFRSGLNQDGPDSDGDGDSGSLLGDYLWQCFPISHLFNSNWGFVKTVSRDPPAGILIQ